MTAAKPNYVTRDFTRDEFEELGVLWGGDAVVRDDIIDNTRWGIVHKVVFRADDVLWEATYEVGATEYQESMDPFEFGAITARKVEPREVTVSEYHPVVAD